MIDQLLDALVRSKNEAADDVLLEALRIGSESERDVVLSALLRRQTTRSLGGVVGRFDSLSEPLQRRILENIKTLFHAIGECGRSGDPTLRLAAMKLIALGRLGKLAYVLSENLHSSDEKLSKAAIEAMVALARWVSTETRTLQRPPDAPANGESPADKPTPQDRADAYKRLIEQRPEIEAAVYRAMDLHRGRHGVDLLRAAMLLADWPGSKTLAILQTTKHGGQSTMVRRLQQTPASEHVEAFLLGATHGQLRSHFGVVFSNIDEAPVLDALLRKTHWLRDHQLQLCMHQVTRGQWWSDAELTRDLERRTPADGSKIAEWVAVSGVHDVVQDERLERLRQHANDDLPARLRLLRVAIRRKRGGATGFLQSFLADPDERLVRMAAREIARRRSHDYESILLQNLSAAPDSVRRVISRAIGQAGFEHFWDRYDRLPKATRKQAGKAMFKILPDALQRLQRKLAGGPLDQRLKAMQVTMELGLGEALKTTLIQLAADPNARLRSKAVTALGGVPGVAPDVLVDRLLQDGDPRVRANTIEVVEQRRDPQFLPLLAQRARDGGNRERANAIKALHSMKLGTAGVQLMEMLRDPRAEHRISAMWAMRQIGWWQLLGEVGRMARQDGDLKVRRYALNVLRGVAELAKAQQQVSQAS